MKSEQSATLLQAFETLNEKVDELACSLRANDQSPLLLPGYSGAPGGELEAAIRSMTLLWYPNPEEQLVEAGLLCADDKTLELASEVNRLKSVFKDAVQEIRKQDSGNRKDNFKHLLARILDGEEGRGEALQAALKNARINRLDLTRCYTHIRILPPQLESISWSWAKNHSSRKQVTLKEAFQMAEKLDDEVSRETAFALLSQLPENEVLTFKKDLPNRLIANIVWREAGERVRKAVTISGVVLSQDKHLPRYVWRENPGKSGGDERLLRFDRKLDEEPYIKVLKLYRSASSPDG